MRKWLQMVCSVLFGLTCATTNAQAAGLESQADNSVRHSESGWIFSDRVGSLKITAAAKIIDGTDDVAASYAKGEGENRIVATVYVYPAKSPALDANFDSAKLAIAAQLRSPLSMAQLWSEGPFTVGSERLLMGRKAFYKVGLGPSSISTILYHYDFGKWIVKIRVTGKESEESFKISDEFVRALPWNSLSIPDGACLGYSCISARPVAIHGMIPEVLAIAMTNKEKIEAEKGALTVKVPLWWLHWRPLPEPTKRGLPFRSKRLQTAAQET